MWAKLMEVENRYTAEMWKELFNAEAVSVLVVPQSGWGKGADMERYLLYVPWGKTHVAEEIMRKI
jgi:hypothetical protein